MKQFYKLFLQSLVLLLLMILQTRASTTGKIAGTLTDKSNDQPMFGATIVVEGTSLGAASDINGNYTILEVPPGTYSLKISFIGFNTVNVNNVIVNIDQTTRIDVAMESIAIEIGETVVLAQRNLIKPDVATSVVSITSKEITDLPIANIQDVLGMQAGINVLTDRYNVGKLQLRGSFADQALFMMDGITMRDPRNNAAITKVPLSAVKEMSVERGGFNAEYGQVQSGIINIVTNEGSKQGYSGSIQVRMTPPAPKYYRGNGIPDVQDPNSYWMRSYLDPAVCWTGTNTQAESFTDANRNGIWDPGENYIDANKDGNYSGWDNYTRSKYIPFVGWDAISKQLNTDNNPYNDLTPVGAQRVFMYETRKQQINNEPDYEIDGGFGGPVPYVSEALGDLRFYTSYRRQREMLLFPMTRPDYVDYDWRLVVNSDINPSMRLRFTGTMGNVATMEDNWNKGAYPHYPVEIAGGTGGSAMFNMFSNWTYALTDIDHRSYAGKFIHNLDTKTYYEVSLEYLRTSYFSRPPDTLNYGNLYEILPGYFETSNPFGYNPNATSSDGIIVYAGEQQSLARDNSVASSTTLRADVTSQVNFSNLVKGGVEFVYNDLNLDYGFIQMQTGGETYASRVQMHNFPIRGGAYLQDKLETKGFTLNAGLRLDYSNSETNWWGFNPYDPYFISNKYNSQRVFTVEKAKGQWQLSPRLGISHPITENSKLFFNYGHFKQMPQYEALLRLDRRPDNTLVRIGDPNLTLAKTISYELGFDYLFPENILLQVTAFYRDISDQQGTVQYQSIGGATYNLTTSNLYSDIRGFELTFRKSTGRWFSGFANYTYQVTSNGNFGESRQYQDPSLQKNWDENTINIYQTRPIPTPNAKANLSFYTPDDFGPVIGGHNILGSFMLNLYLNWSQGGWTTYNPKNISGVNNNVQYVDYFDAAMRFSKTIPIKNFLVQLFVDASNLFNTLRLRDDGDQNYRISLHLPKNEAYDNIPGNDKLGDYREPGVEWQPMEYQAVIDQTKPASSTRAIYYEGTTGKYWQYADNQWAQVEQSRMDQINKDKAYINMAGPSTFWFLNPRAITFGIRVSFNFN